MWRMCKFCNSAEYDVIGFKDTNSPPEYINKDKCLEYGICYYICPQTHVLEKDLNKTYNFSDFDSMPLGFFDDIYTYQATDGDFLKYGTEKIVKLIKTLSIARSNSKNHYFVIWFIFDNFDIY